MTTHSLLIFHLFSLAPYEGTTITLSMSDQDIEDVVDVLEPNELKHLYKELKVTTADKEEAIKENLDPKAEARLILKYFRQINGEEATREKIIDALKANKLTWYAAYKLEQRWNIQCAPQGDGNVNLNESATYSQDAPKKKKQKCSAE